MTVTSNKLILAGARINGDFGTQTYNVRDLDLTTSSDHNVNIAANGAMTIDVEDDIDISSHGVKFMAGGDMTFTTFDYTLAAGGIDMFANDDISMDFFDSLDFKSPNFLYLEGMEGIFESDQEYSFEVTGTTSIDADDLTFDAIDDLDLVAGDDIHFDVSESTEIVSGDFSITVNNGVYMKTSVFSANADDFSITSNNGDITGYSYNYSFDASDSIDIVSTDDTIVNAGGDISFTSVTDQDFSIGQDLRITTQETTSLSGSDSLTVNIEDEFLITGSEELKFEAGGDLTLSSTNTLSVNGLNIEYSSGKDITITSPVSSFDGGDVFAESGNDIIFDAENNVRFSTPSGTREIVFFGRSIEFDTDSSWTTTVTSEATLYGSNVSLDAGNDIAVNAQFSQMTSQTVTTTTTSTTSIGGDNLVNFITGYDNYFNVNSADDILFEALNNLEIDSESSIEYEAGTSITINSASLLRFESLESTIIQAGATFTATGTNSVVVNSAEDASFETQSANDIVMTSTSGAIESEVGRDFHMVANAILRNDNCGVSVATTGGNEATFHTTNGVLTADSYDHMAITSSGNIDVMAGGDIFAESYENGIAFFAESNTAGISIQTTKNQAGNIEFLSTEAEVRMFAFSGFDFTGGEDVRFTAERELNITALSTPVGNTGETITFDGDRGAFFSGARGITFKAGKDAPVFDGDFTVDSKGIYIESQDRIHALALQKFSVESQGNGITLTSHDGHRIDFSAHGQIKLTAGNDVKFTTLDGDQLFVANDDHIRGTIGDDISIDTNNGPIEMRALAGGFTLSGNDWEITSNMDLRALAQGNITVNAGANLQLEAKTDQSHMQKNCILLQNERPVDNILFNGANVFASASAGNFFFDEPNILVKGQNVDYVIANGAAFTSQTKDVTIGEDSTPEIRIIAGGDAGNAGIIFDSISDINVNTSSTLSFDATNIEFTVLNLANFLSAGFINLKSTVDFNLLATAANTGIVTVDGESVTNTVTGDHTITADSLLLEQRGFDIDGRLFIESTGVTLTAVKTTFEATNLHDLDVAGSTTLSADAVTFANTVPDDTNFVNPFFSDIQNERGDIYFTISGDLDADVVTDTTITVGRTDPGVPLNNQPTFELNTNEYSLTTESLAVQIMQLGALFKMNAGNTFTVQSTADDILIDTAPLPEGANKEPFENHPSDLVIHANQGVSQKSTAGNFIQTATAGQEFDVGGPTSFVFTDSFQVTLTDAALNSLIEFNAGGTLSFGSGGDTTINLLDSTSGISSFEEEYNMYFQGEKSVLIPTTTSTTITSNFEQEYKGSSYAINSPDIDLLSTASITFQSTDLASDVIFDTTDITFTDVSANGWTATGSEGVIFDVTNDQEYSITNLVAKATYGDIYMTSALIDIDATVGALVYESFGYQSDNERGITFDVDTLGFVSSTSAITIEAKDSIETIVDGLLTLNSPIFDFQSTGFNAPIRFLGHNDDIPMVATGILSIEGGRGTYISGNNALTFNTPDLDVVTSFKDSGILFDTDIKINANSVINVGATTSIGQDASVFNFETDFSRAANSPINFLVDTLAIQGTGNFDIPFTATEGAISIATTTSTLLNAVDISLIGDTNTWNVNSWALSVTGNSYMDSFDGDIRFKTGTTATSLTVANELAIRSVGNGQNNDITFATPAALSITSTGDVVRFHANRGSGGIHIENDFSAISTLAMRGTTLNYHTESGISITGTKHTGTNLMSFTSNLDTTIQTKDRRGVVFFQSDHDTIVSSNVLIQHTSYNNRMGFFSEVPDWIHYANMQDTEICLQGGWCGFASISSRGNVNPGIQNLNNVAVTLQNLMRRFGLLNYKHPLV